MCIEVRGQFFWVDCLLSPVEASSLLFSLCVCQASWFRSPQTCHCNQHPSHHGCAGISCVRYYTLLFVHLGNWIQVVRSGWHLPTVPTHWPICVHFLLTVQNKNEREKTRMATLTWKRNFPKARDHVGKCTCPWKLASSCCLSPGRQTFGSVLQWAGELTSFSWNLGSHAF